MKFNILEIVEKIKTAQDKELLNWLYMAVYPKVRNYVMGNNGSVDDSKDVFQETVLILYKLVIENKYSHIKDIEGFLITVSRNIWINMCKKSKRLVHLNDEVENPFFAEENPLIDIIMTEKWDAFRQLFEMVGERCRQLLTHYTYEKRSMEEIAVKMNLPSANAAKALHYRCKQKLIDLVAADKELARSLYS